MLRVAVISTQGFANSAGVEIDIQTWLNNNPDVTIVTISQVLMPNGPAYNIYTLTTIIYKEDE